MPKIVITNRVHEQVLTQLKAHGEVLANPAEEPWPADQILREAREATALMAFMPDCIDAAFLDACPRLAIIACALKGHDNFDREACTRRGVWLATVPDELTGPTAELTIGLMIAVSRKVLAGDRLIRGGSFDGWRPRLYGAGLAGSQIGILGMGAIGRAVARGLAGFEVRIAYWDQNGLAPEDEAALALQRADLHTLIAEADFLVSALPLNADTHHLLSGEAIARMKPGAFLINPSRGGVVDEAAVGGALDAGHLGGYAADVFELEDWARPDRPRTINARILAHAERTVLTPHLGSAVAGVRLAIEREAADNIVDVLEGRAPRGAVNRPGMC